MQRIKGCAVLAAGVIVALIVVFAVNWQQPEASTGEPEIVGVMTATPDQPTAAPTGTPDQPTAAPTSTPEAAITAAPTADRLRERIEDVPGVVRVVQMQTDVIGNGAIVNMVVAVEAVEFETARTIMVIAWGVVGGAEIDYYVTLVGPGNTAGTWEFNSRSDEWRQVQAGPGVATLPTPTNCAAARAAGLTAAQAGAFEHLDRDGDRVACYGD